ncbi:MAG: glycosyltransferase family 4 protein [Bryobacteraceae bacterium]
MSEARQRLVLVSGGIPLGGSTTFLLNLAGELVRRNVPVLVVSLEHSNPHAEDFHARGIPLHCEDERVKVFEDRLASALQAVRRFEPTAVVACLGPSSYEMLRYLPAGILRLGMIQSDFPENYPPFVPYVPFLDGMIAVSRQIERNLCSHPRFGTISTHCLPYGVAMPNSGCGSSCALTTTEPLRVLYLGRLSNPQKRVRLFPDVLEQLRKAAIPMEWTIAGDGPERAWLEENMKGDANVRVRFVGALQYKEVPRILEQNDVFLLMSDAEGLPISLLEAMAHGLVPVVSDLASGVSEVTDAQCAMLVPTQKTAGYAEAIIWLSQHRLELSKMSAHAVEKVRNTNSVEAMTDRWIEVLDAQPKTTVTRWPNRLKVTAPLSHPNLLRFSPPIRWIRRRWRAWAARRLSNQASRHHDADAGRTKEKND